MGCGAAGNNFGVALPNMPVAANSSCACQQLCEKNGKCAAWTYTGKNSEWGTNCYLRANWGERAHNCGDNCRSGQKGTALEG